MAKASGTTKTVTASAAAASRRYGCCFKFDARNRRIKFLQRRKNQRMKNAQALGRPAFIEWRKYQDYVYEHMNPVWK